MIECTFSFSRYWYLSLSVLFFTPANSIFGDQIELPIFPIVIIAFLSLILKFTPKDIFRRRSLVVDEIGLSIGKLRIPANEITKVMFLKPQSIYIYRMKGNWFHRIVHINMEKNIYPQAENLLSQWAKSSDIPLQQNV